MAEKRTPSERFNTFVHRFAWIAFIGLIGFLLFLGERELNRETYRKDEVREMIMLALESSQYAKDEKFIKAKLGEIDQIKGLNEHILRSLQALGVAVNNSLSVTPREVLAQVKKIEAELERLRNRIEIVQRLREQESKEAMHILRELEKGYRSGGPGP